MIAFLRWLLGRLRRRGPVRRTLVMEFATRVVEVTATELPDGTQKFDLVVLSGRGWSEEEAMKVLAFFKAELDRLGEGADREGGPLDEFRG